jgi:hypothetical protein
VDRIEKCHQYVHVQEGNQRFLLLIPQPVDQLQAHRTLIGAMREQGHSITNFRRLFRGTQSLPGKFRQNLSHGTSPKRSDLLGSEEHVFVEI